MSKIYPHEILSFHSIAHSKRTVIRYFIAGLHMLRKIKPRRTVICIMHTIRIFFSYMNSNGENKIYVRKKIPPLRLLFTFYFNNCSVKPQTCSERLYNARTVHDIIDIQNASPLLLLLLSLLQIRSHDYII